MDSLRFLLAIVLTIAVIILTNILFPPAQPPATADLAPDTVSAPAPQAEPPAQPPALAAPPAVVDAPEPAPEPVAPPVETIEVRSPLYRFLLSSRGAAILSAELTRFGSFTRDGPVELAVPELGPLVAYQLRVGDRILDLSGLDFQLESNGAVELHEASAPETLRFIHDGRPRIAIEYTFHPDSYMVRVSGSVDDGAVDALYIELPPTLAINEANVAEDERALAYVVNSRRQGIRSQRLDGVDAQQIEEGPLVWVAIKNKYFVLGAVAGEGEAARSFGGLIARPLERQNAARLTATMPLPGEPRFDFGLYIGPQEHERLVAVGQDFADVNPYGWRVFRPIIRPLAHLITWALVGLHRILDIGYGWVLVLFGFIVRLVLWPLNSSAMRSQMRNMELQPRMKEIQTKYKAEPEKLQKEMMRLYKEEGFNPFGGCLPMLIPFPVLITLFFVFQSTIEFRGVEFLWLPDLAQRDPIYVLPVLLGVSMFVMQWVSMRAMPMQNPQMKFMLWFLPIFMVIIFLNLASGLNLYYFASNVASIPQQIQIARERKRVQSKMSAKEETVVVAPAAAPAARSAGQRKRKGR
jgi:YidC/Oxa1 family membrane protein insertase